MAKRLYAAISPIAVAVFKNDNASQFLRNSVEGSHEAATFPKKRIQPYLVLKMLKGELTIPEAMNTMRATVVLVPAGFCMKCRRSTRFCQ